MDTPQTDGNDAAALLRKFRCKVVYATTNTQATAAIAAVIAEADGGLIGFDTETAPNPSARQRLAELQQQQLTAKGRLKAAERLHGRAKQPTDVRRWGRAEVKWLTAQIGYADEAGFDPQRASIRLLQAYGGGPSVAVIDMAKVSWSALAALWEAPLVVHNAVFDLAFLSQAGIEPATIHCTLQACRLLYGSQGNSLEERAATVLSVEIDKKEQRSDWGARHLTARQINYAALDAVVVKHLAERVLPRLAEREPAYTIQMAVIPAVVRMRLRGFKMDVAAHAELIGSLAKERQDVETAYAEACRNSGRDDLAAEGMPTTPAGKEELLKKLLTSDELAEWTRTEKSGHLSTKRAEMRRAAHYPPIVALARAAVLDKQLSSFGMTLAARVSPVTGRLHADTMVAGAKSGRAICSKPNLQQIPKDGAFRKLFIAEPGHVLVGADYNSMELRAAAEISGDEVMRDAFRRGDDLHEMTAMQVTGKTAATAITEDERNAAKRVNFGAIYGIGPKGLSASIWDAYGRLLPISEAKLWLDGFAIAYPTLAAQQRRHAEQCKREGRIVIGRQAAEGIGRVFELVWLKVGKSVFTVACNLPVQGICADIAMQALAGIDEALFLAGVEGGPVAWTHDEIVLEVAKKDAKKASRLLTTVMRSAFAQTFPSAPLTNLVAAFSGPNWGALKKKKPGKSKC